MRPLLSERQKDRVATVLIRTGGLLVILVVAGIVINIASEALPLFGGAVAGPVVRVEGDGPFLVAGSDARREFVWALDPSGAFHFPESGIASLTIGEDLSAPLVAADHEIHGLISAIDETGTAVVGRIRFTDSWTDDTRSTTARWRASADPVSLGSGEWVGVTANADEYGNLVVAGWDRSGRLSMSFWDGEDEYWEPLTPSYPLDDVAAAAVAESLESVAVIDFAGGLRVLRLPDLTVAEVAGLDGPVSRARFLIGGGSLVVAGRDGGVAVLLNVPRIHVLNHGTGNLRIGSVKIAPGEAVLIPDDEVGRKLADHEDVRLEAAPARWQLIRRLGGVPGPPTMIAPEHRRRGFAVATETGHVGLFYSTSGRRLLLDSWRPEALKALSVDPKGDGAVAITDGGLMRRWIRNPHPETTFRTLFLPVWYEGYAAPKWVWQSTGGSDAFEAKLSVWPLIFGTLKATMYAMMFSVPLALLAAVYVSQLAPPWLQATVKPTLELMAAVPSVVVGFLAALWLAPRLEQALLAVMLCALALPLVVVVSLAVMRLVPTNLRRRFPDGAELGVLLIVGGAVAALVAAITGPIEAWLFDGDFQRFLFTEWGMRYDQRNSIVVGLALGFAVIPVIFTIAEDACSAVPRALVNASRALGATRWQTAVRLVVPAASPGLFAAVMLGLGRAVGETMIVLMAAGNTPLLDLSLFNGMRTMSAAIAVEIPEAPVGGTLFRILFLTGALLFVFTFILTTAADSVGSYLRKRYARF